MIRILEFSKVRPEEILNRAIQTETEVDEIVAGILADVRENGDAALRKYAEKFDGAALDSLEVAVAHEASHAGDEPGHRRRAQLVLRGLDQVAQHPNAPREVGRALHPVDQRRVEQECPLQGERAVLTMGGAVDPAARGDEVDVVLGAG